MKAILIILSTVLYLSAGAQNMVLQSGAEKTVAGIQLYTSASAESKTLWALGMFYQAGVGRYGPEQNASIAKPFYGILLQVPLIRSERIALLANLRSGFVDEKFFIITPSLETRIKLSARTGLSVGSGFRMGQPSLQAKAFIKIF